MLPPIRHLRVLVSCLLALTSLTAVSVAQQTCAGTRPCVTTWHNDNNRTGLQPKEAFLTQSTVNQSTFGLLWQWPVTGFVFAQPLAVADVSTTLNHCSPSCDLVFVATEQDMLYAFNAEANLSTPVWSRDLAGYVGGTYVTCSSAPADFPPCAKVLLGPYVGVTGTPVVDMTTTPHPTLYVTAAVEVSGAIGFYLYAIDITTGVPLGTVQYNPVKIAGSVTGQPPSTKCTSDYPGNGGQIPFGYQHIQRSALLLLPTGTVYVAFSSGNDETNNGWMFGYQYNFTNNTFSQTAKFNSTPYGTGGGIWQAGAGPASDGASIYAVTANGTLFDATLGVIDDRGDSLLRLDPSSLAVLDYYAPSDVLTYPSTNLGVGYCINDFDFGSGGVLVFPDAFYHDLNTGGYPNLLVNADKESNLSVTNRDNLGNYNSSGGNNIQTVLTPCSGTPCLPLDTKQGYWASPAYWEYTSGSTTNHMLYYTATTENKIAKPYPINAYQLLISGHSGPILQAPTASTPTLFCYYSPTPSVSSNGTSAGTGIVWAIEHGNTDNPAHNDCNGTAVQAALHAFNATNLAAPTPLYDSRGLAHHTTGSFTTFSTPTIFNGYVYMGTQTEVNVFGLCSSQQAGCPLQ